jgi:hypothetical protein
MTVPVANTHARIQRLLLSAVKVTTMLERCITEEQRSLVRLCG